MKLVSQKDNEIIMLNKHDIKNRNNKDNDKKENSKDIKNISPFDIAKISQRLSSIYEIENKNNEIKANKKQYENIYSLDTVFKFGKYKQILTLKNVIDDDYSYLQFCLSKNIFKLDEKAKEYVDKRNNKSFETMNDLKKQIENKTFKQDQYTDFNRDESPNIVEVKLTIEEIDSRRIDYIDKIDSLFLPKNISDDNRYDALFDEEELDISI